MPGLTTSCHNVSSLECFMDKINGNDNDVTKVHNEIIFLDTKVNSHCTGSPDSVGRSASSGGLLFQVILPLEKL